MRKPSIALISEAGNTVLDTAVFDVTAVSDRAQLSQFIHDLPSSKYNSVMWDDVSNDVAMAGRALCEHYGIRYIGAPLLAAGVMNNRDMAMRVALTHGMLTPDFTTFYSEETVDYSEIALPSVIKPAMSMAKNATKKPATFSELKEDMAKTFAMSSAVVVENYLEGRLFSVFLYGDRDAPNVLSPVETTTAPELDTLEPEKAEIAQNLGRRAWKIFGARDLMRVNFIYVPSQELFYFLEVHSHIPLTGNYLLELALADSMSVRDLASQLIGSSVAKPFK